MHRIDTATAQKDKFGAGKDGFTRGNPQTGTPATDLDDDYFDMLQEELVGVVESAGIELDKSKHDQLLTALKMLFLQRTNPFGDIKNDGAAAIATALTNLQLVGGLGSTTVGRLVGVQVITSSGTYTPTAGAKFGIARGVGGGAGGGGSSTPPSGQVSSGAGGNSGSYAETRFSITGPIPVTIGAGGPGGPGSATSTGASIGGAGGDTIFGSLMTCPGGNSGLASNSFTIPNICQSIQTRSATPTGPINLFFIEGEAGGNGLALGGGISGRGGSNPLGSGGQSVGSGGNSSVAGNNGSGYGAGGSGAFSGSSGAGKSGGNGTPGVIIIMEYA